MNPVNLKEAEKLLNSLKRELILSPRRSAYSRRQSAFNVWIAPPSLYFHLLKEKFGKFFDFGLQNVFFQQSGAFTGEISPLMAKNSGAKFVILGHSERKRLGENLEMINKKVLASLESGLKVSLCFGEDKKTKINSLIKIWENQLKISLSGVSKNEKNLILVYEPSWAISSQGIGAAPKEYLEFFLKWYRKTHKFPIFYGGSVNSGIIGDYLELGFNGYLIGSASLKIEEMKKIVKLINDNEKQ